MRIMFDIIDELAVHVYAVRLSPADARRLPGTPCDRADRTIVLASDGGLNSYLKILCAEFDDLRVLTVGSTESALVIFAEPVSKPPRKRTKRTGSNRCSGS